MTAPPLDVWYEESWQDLPWAGLADSLLLRRCRARLPREALPRPGRDAFFGRCELRAHSPGLAHALERGMVAVRFRDAPS